MAVCDEIGKHGLKFFKEPLIEEVDINFILHLMEEMIEDNEYILKITEMDLGKLRKERIKLWFSYWKRKMKQKESNYSSALNDLIHDKLLIDSAEDWKRKMRRK
jgi:hypothetical protein